MMLKIYLSLTILIFFLEDSKISCYGNFGITNKLLGKSLKRFLPFDLSSINGLMNVLSYIKTKAEKIQGSPESIQNAILAETSALLKETVLPLPAVTDEDIFFYNPQSKSGKMEPFTLEELSETKGELFFIVHGWSEDSSDADWCRKMAKSLANNFKKSEVVLVDWGSSSNKYLYPLAALRTKAVGKVIANKITELVEKHCFPLEDIIFIGYDLGAHVCGHVGRFFAEANEKKLPEIIGLDPSGLLFEGRNPEERLDETDAEIVMVVHTGSSMVGVTEKCGTIDFYPNGGSSQPGCSDWNLICKHQRSYQLFTAAISAPKKFSTMKCNNSQEYEKKKCDDSDVYFGDISKKSKGKYYFETTDKEPFYQTTKIKISLLNWF